MLLPSFFGRYGLQVFISFDNCPVDFFGNGKYFLYIADEFVLLCHFTPVLEFKRFENVDGRQFDVWNGVTFINAHRSKEDTFRSILFGGLLGMANEAS